MDYTNVLPVGNKRNPVSINQSVLCQIKKKKNRSVVWTNIKIEHMQDNNVSNWGNIYSGLRYMPFQKMSIK